jgi:choline dehydrogenase
MMLSGIGPADHLRSHGIDVLHDSPGVGMNLHDHVYIHSLASVNPIFSINHKISSNVRMIPDVIRYLVSKKGLLNSAAAQVGLFARSGVNGNRVDLQMQMRPFSMLGSGGMYKADKDPAITASCGLLHIYSKGRLTLKSNDFRDPPQMLANYLTDDRDIKPLVVGLKIIRNIFQTAPFSTHFNSELMPGPTCVSDADYESYIRDHSQTMYHPVGTCRMGPDELGVVDHRLRVKGVSGLRIVDASAMPQVPSGNTSAPVIMMAEKASKMILEDRKKG